MEHWPGPARGAFANPENTICHLNSALQGLLASPLFVRALRRATPADDALTADAPAWWLLAVTERMSALGGTVTHLMPIWRTWVERMIGPVTQQQERSPRTHARSHAREQTLSSLTPHSYILS